MRFRRETLGPGQESVWDYPRPPRVETSAERVRVVHREMVLADTTSSLRVLETAHAPAYYLPRSEVAVDYLRPSSRHTYCEFKGRASYADLVLPGQPTVADACWWYPDPSTGFEILRDAVCFYPQRVDLCEVDGEAVVPLDSDFYGDWPTSRIAGPFKGGPGVPR